MSLLIPASLTWHDGVPEAPAYGDIYFSRDDGLAESRYVFIEGNQLPERFAALEENQHFIIGETGFGTGLNFLLTWQLWQQLAPKTAKLTFISTELHPLLPDDLARALHHWPTLAAEAEQLIQHYPPLMAGFHTIQLSESVELLLLYGDARETLPALLDTSHPGFSRSNPWHVDAWFLDGFAPSKNPELWQLDLLQHLAALSKPGTTLATFTAQGALRRALLSLNFAANKRKGFGHKREMITACYQGEFSPLASEPQTPWLLSASPLNAREKTCAVIGAGIAGCHAARALAEAGFQVSVFERDSDIANAASGNPEGALYTKLSSHQGHLTEYSLAAFAYAISHYQQDYFKDCFTPCGLLQQAPFEPALDELLKLAGLGEWLDAEQASHKAGITLTQGGWWLPKAGALKPREVCQALLDHPNIELQLNADVQAIYEHEKAWQLQGEFAGSEKTFGHVVCASALSIEQLTDCAPLKPVRGQVSFHQTPPVAHANIVICAEGYATPNGVFGASFYPNCNQTDIRVEDQQHNLNKLAEFSPELAAQWAMCELQNRASVRAASNDYLPFVGPVPAKNEFIESYQALKHNARQVIHQPQHYRAGLWVFGGLGGRGLTYAPLAATLLVSLMTDAPRPVPRRLHEALVPARHLLKQIIRRQL